jgi:methylmalonyl-CoA carboxyltransferase large subunit
MVETIPQELVTELEELRKLVASLSSRIAILEKPAPVVPVANIASPAAEPPQSITEEEILAISAALAAYLGVRVRIRQIRLISSGAWASEGRATIQASHRLHS